uniref:PERP, TP53 apoptosis effector n=1 Tax=Nothobranchius korthausae TaxID=1143690 RepID=A0A1A8FC50_9TELE
MSFRCGIDYTRCKCILPLLLIFACIFDLIAIAARSGWVENENKSHYGSMWDECRGKNDVWDCRSLMENPWAIAVAALMIIGFLLLILCLIFSFMSLCGQLRTGLFIPIGILLLLVAIIQIIALIVYPVNFNDLIYEGSYYYTWAYGFGWGATILCIGLALIFFCLPRWENEIVGEQKIKYIYESK